MADERIKIRSTAHQFCAHASESFQTFGACSSSRPLPSQGGESGLIPGAQVLGKHLFLKGLILAQNERWRRGLGMQVERIPEGLLFGGSGERGSKAWVTYPGDWDSLPNGRVIPGDSAGPHGLAGK